MSLSTEMESELNAQLNFELCSSYLYVAMAAHLTSDGFPGAAHWMRMQAHEELLHSLKVHDFILERGGEITLSAVDAPPTGWDSLRSVFDAAYEHETGMTTRLNALMEVAVAERDHASQSMLRWFIDEQVEEEASVSEVVHKLNLIDSGSGLYLMDRELAARSDANLPQGV